MSSIFSLNLYNTLSRGLTVTTKKKHPVSPSLGSLPIMHNWHFITQLTVVNAFSAWTNVNIPWAFVISISFPLVINCKIWPQIPPMILCNMTLCFCPLRGYLFPHFWILIDIFIKDFTYLFLESEKRETGGTKHCCETEAKPEPQMQAHALTGNWNSNLSPCGTSPNQLSHTSQGWTDLMTCFYQ